jgi:hypothetical protein
MALLLNSEGLFAAAVAVWGMTTLLDMIFFFVTAGLGIQEGGHQAAFLAVGLPGASGVSLSLVSRLDQLFWIAVGLAAGALMEARSHAAAHRHGG